MSLCNAHELLPDQKQTKKLTESSKRYSDPTVKQVACH